MPDKYANFEQLARSEMEGVDFQLRCRYKASSTVIVAPHGGGIEPGTSEIADAIAANDFSFYAFEGLKLNHNRSLHITSCCFDEPRCIALIEDSTRVVTIHGECSDKNAVFLGGRDDASIARIKNCLEARNFLVRSGMCQ